MRRHFLFGMVLALVLGALPVMAGGNDAGAGFPAGFWWGTSISAHSVEGGHINDWTMWENMPGKIVDGSKSGPACNHWELYAEDHAWMKKFGQNAVLMSIEWSRIEPMRNVYDTIAVEHYRKMLSSLRKNGIEPIVILCDRTFPTWASGRLDAPSLLFDFMRYAAYAGKTFGDLVDFWIPVRDPIGLVARTFKDGIYPPGRVEPAAYGKAALNMTAIHRTAATLLHQNDSASAGGLTPVKVGALVGMRLVRAHDQANPSDLSLAQAAQSLSSDLFLESILLTCQDPVAQPGSQPLGKGAPGQGQATPPMPPTPAVSPYQGSFTNFIVCAYNGLNELKFNAFKALGAETVVPPGSSVDDAGQVIYPAGLPPVLASLKRYGVPLYAMIGIADAEGTKRSQFLIDHVREAKAAIQQGTDLRGIFYNSLLSGFEFERGYSLKRGLLDVNTKVQERKPAPGADVFRGLATSNGSDERPRPMRRPKLEAAAGESSEADPAAPAAPAQPMQPTEGF